MCHFPSIQSNLLNVLFTYMFTVAQKHGAVTVDFPTEKLRIGEHLTTVGKPASKWDLRIPGITANRDQLPWRK